MRFYDSIQLTNLDVDEVIRAKRFAEKVVSTTDYSDSNQSFREKIQMDHFISNLGEEAVRKVLQAYAKVEGPDYAIYEAKEKSWEADLLVNAMELAVKTQAQSSAIKYGRSWTFQDGMQRRDTILDKPKAWVVFVLFDDLQPYRFLVYPPFQICELTFGEPKLAQLKGAKKVVYAEGLPGCFS
jgi:transposase